MMTFKNKMAYAGLMCLIVLGLSGCGDKGKGREVVAKIGKAAITVSDFNERVSNLPARFQDVISKRKKEFLQEIINDTLLYQAALKRGLDKDKDVQKVIDEAKKKIVIARYLKDNIDDKIEITDAEILQYYNEHQNEFMTPEIIRASHILVATQDEALNILGEIMKGGSFEDLARTRSIDPTAQKGGDIGYFPKGQLIAEFEAACEKLKVGEVSEPVKTKLGYHIIKLTDRKSATAKLLKDVKEDIKARMKVKKRQEMFTALLNNLSKETKVVVNEDALRDTGVADSGNAGK